MSAEPAKAKHDTEHHEKHEAAATPITITSSPSGYGFSPASLNVPNGSTITFIATQTCWVWTYDNGAYTNVFNGESNNHVQCQPGASNFVLSAAASNTTVLIVGTNVNGQQPPPPDVHRTESVHGTIKIGN